MTIKQYDAEAIETKWQQIWEETDAFKAEDHSIKPKYYALVEFPYPSGEGLHVGHPRSYTALDIIARKYRLQGYNVLYPMGWDAFGLPTENYAIKHQIHPKTVTEKNIANFRRQLKSLGYSFDWSREISSADSEYYRWTQWIFLKLFEKNLAYKAEIPINWCVDCKTGLANEEVVDGVCERCGGEVIKKIKSQWMLKITEYAERLLHDLEQVDYIDRVKLQQQNWIGRSEGMLLRFPISGLTVDQGEQIEVFTTKPHTIKGATYLVLAPEHNFLDAHLSTIQNWSEIEDYRQQIMTKSDLERTDLNTEKTGVLVKGLQAINPYTDEFLPIWISDYVLVSYGTGAIMAVPGEDRWDLEFAQKYNLSVIEITEETNSEIVHQLITEGYGEQKVNYRLRDWVFSRQRYWGEPIPLIFCKKCGWVPVPEEELPVILPDVDSFEPTETGESPLASIEEWVNTSCPNCGKPAKRETDTMPNWAGSSWYFLRYVDPMNEHTLADAGKLKYWLPIDWYNGGMEHTTLHLLYSRFWHKFLYDIGIVSTSEPYRKRTSHGMILGENHEKMSKSRGNVVNPDQVIREFGADSVRLFEMFLGAFDQPIPWSTQGLIGCRRFIERVWKLQELVNKESGYSVELESLMHKTIKKVSTDFDNMKFNTAIAALMSLLNEFYNQNRVTSGEFKTFLILLNPVVPHLTEELWELMGYRGRLYETSWVNWDEEKTIDNILEIVVQINGKVRARVEVPAGSSQSVVRTLIMEEDSVRKYLIGKAVVKEVFVEDKIYSFVIS